MSTTIIKRYGAYLQDETHGIIRADVEGMEDKELFSLGAKVDAVASVIRDEQDKRIRAWHAEGLTIRDIAERVGVHNSTISRREATLGLERNDSRGGARFAAGAANGDIDPGELLPDEGGDVYEGEAHDEVSEPEPKPAGRALDALSTIDQWCSGAMVFRLKAARAEIVNVQGARAKISKLRAELDEIERMLPPELPTVEPGSAVQQRIAEAGERLRTEGWR